MDKDESGESQANARKERLKGLAVAGGETMFQGFCYTVGMLLATVLVESMRNRIKPQ